MSWYRIDERLLSKRINFNGACGGSKGEKIGLSFVARDHFEKLLLVGSRTISLDGSAEDSEIRALCWALSVAREQGWEHVIFEGDCQDIIAAVSRKKQGSFHVQVVVDNCILCSKSFQSCSFMFCFRECNSVAHRLARWVVASFCDEVWVHNAPTWLKDALYSNSFLSEC
ncbi:unnamed protein product [Amaranthus hypochondriacus]